MFYKVLSGVFLFVLSYLRHTIFFNINFKGEPWLFFIDKFNSPSLSQASQSVFIFFILFAFCNLFLAFALKKEVWKWWMALYFLLFGVAVLFFLIHYLTQGAVFYQLGSIIKNFLLSPLYPLLLIVFYFKKSNKDL